MKAIRAAFRFLVRGLSDGGGIHSDGDTEKVSRCGEGRKFGFGRVDFEGPLKHPSRDARWAAGCMVWWLEKSHC